MKFIRSVVLAISVLLVMGGLVLTAAPASALPQAVTIQLQKNGVPVAGGYVNAFYYNATTKAWTLSSTGTSNVTGVAQVLLEPGSYRFCYGLNGVADPLGEYQSACLGGDVVATAQERVIAGPTYLGAYSLAKKTIWDVSRVRVVGDPTVGQRLMVDVNSLLPEPTDVYVEWYRDGAKSGAGYVGQYLGNSPSYLVKTADVGHTLAARIFPYSNRAMTPGGTIWTPQTAVVTMPMGFSSAPQITAKKWRVRRVASYVAPSMTPPGAAATFQWLRNGNEIAGATGATYKMKRKDRRKRLSLRITYSAASYKTVTLETAPSRKIR